MQKQGNGLDFNGQTIYVGIDAHLKSWKVSLMTAGIMEKTFSQDADPEALHNYLTKRYPGASYESAYEAGFCGFSIHRRLSSLGIKNLVVNPADIPVTDKEKKQKEDQRDSRRIVRSLANGTLKSIHIPSLAFEELRTFVRYRKTLIKEINRHKLRVKSLLYYYGIAIPLAHAQSSKHWSKAFTTWLKSLDGLSEGVKAVLDHLIDTVTSLRTQLLAVNRDLKKISRSDMFSTQVALLQSVPGIGFIVAITLISELEDIKRFGNLDHLCAYVGLIPTTHSSGEHDRVGHITPRSNRGLRSMLIESAWVAVRHDPALMLCYQKLIGRMPPSKAIIRIAKKLLSRIKYVLKNNETYIISVVK
ncbi:MAG: IS110 family transposase [Cytophagales bacterium]|nr:IS110 family transposase [Cytophagales bacterium]